MPTLHIIQHVPFEPAGILPDLAFSHGWNVSTTKQFAADNLPELNTIDRLIIMGGPMSTNDITDYPYLSAEKDFLNRAIAKDIPVIGICLGAQLLAEALGGKVHSNAQKEIGFFPVQKTTAAYDSQFFADLPHTFTPLHWHGDTFSLPPGATHTARSAACNMQAFESGPHIGLQFHLEMTTDLLEGLIENARHELVAAPFVMTEAKIKEAAASLHNLQPLMTSLFERWLS